MSAPSSSTRPVIQPCSDSSCIRLRVRRKVDFPQPEGPMSACTRLGGKLNETSFTATNSPYMAESFSVTIRGASGAAGWTGGAARLRVTSAIETESATDGKASSQTQDENHQDQHQRRGPGVLMPLLVGTRGVGEHGERQRRHRLIQVEAQVLAAEGGKKEWSGLPRDPGNGQQGAGHDPRQRRPD